MIGEYFNNDGCLVGKPVLQLHKSMIRAVIEVEHLIGGKAKNITKNWALVSNGTVNVVISDED